MFVYISLIVNLRLDDWVLNLHWREICHIYYAIFTLDGSAWLVARARDTGIVVVSAVTALRLDH